jgi:hypothetical protein
MPNGDAPQPNLPEAGFLKSAESRKKEIWSMALIRVPRPKDAYNPDRPMGSLLKAQVEHLREAESKLPLRYRQQIDTYIKAIKTEGEAAAYIRQVTQAIHDAHADAERARRAPKRKTVIKIAVSDQRARRRKSARKRRATKPKKRVGSKSRKK